MDQITDEELARVRAAFFETDWNQSGSIPLPELAATLRVSSLCPIRTAKQ